MRRKTHERILREERRRWDEERRELIANRERLIDRLMAIVGIHFDVDELDERRRMPEPDEPGDERIPLDGPFDPYGEEAPVA